MATDLERFIACMEYEACDRRPNHELGAWGQTVERWLQEAPEAAGAYTWNWFWGEDALNLDRRDYVPIHRGFIPHFEPQVLEENEDYVVARHGNGIVTKALKRGTVRGTRMCMDTYLEFPVKTPEDFPDIKRRLVASAPGRLPEDLDQQVAAWKERTCPLVCGRNCDLTGFYWWGRELMGTEALSFAWYDHPELMHEMMEFIADFTIEVCRPVMERIEVEYVVLNEDLSMKVAPLLSPATFREFIFPHLKRVVEFFRGHGTRYFAVDTDGNPMDLIPLYLDAGVDTLWPIERASDISPQQIRRRFGKSLRLWGGVDKRILARDPDAIRAHLREFIPLIEEGGFIPTVDHTVSPEVSWDNWCYYMDLKRALLAGDFAKLE